MGVHSPCSQISKICLGSAGYPGYVLDIWFVLLALLSFFERSSDHGNAPCSNVCSKAWYSPQDLYPLARPSRFPFAAHPTDAHIKCVAEEHFLKVARRHERPLQSSAPSVVPSGAALTASSQEHVPLTPENGVPSFQADLIQKLSCLETKVVTLQEQLAQLALALLQEREISVERRLSALETTTTELLGKLGFSPSLPESLSPGTGPERVGPVHVPRLLNPAEHRARSRMPPLIEYSAQGDYVIVSSQDGELHLLPDSTEWFDWPATLSSFRFIGK